MSDDPDGARTPAPVEHNGVEVRIRRDGPYLVTGVPLVRRHPLSSDRSEPLSGPPVETLADGSEPYALCRCGSSPTRPFCDGTHRTTGFDGSPARLAISPRGPCSASGDMSLSEASLTSGDTSRRRDEAVVAGADGPGAGIAIPLGSDPSLEVALITDGPVWLTGGIPIDHRQGEPLPVADRLALCRCGASSDKPYCDGTHIHIGFTG